MRLVGNRALSNMTPRLRAELAEFKAFPANDKGWFGNLNFCDFLLTRIEFWMD